jgi:hypothetical protein
MTRTTSSIFVFMLAAAVGCGSDWPPAETLCEPLEAAPCYSGPPSAGGVGACSLGTAVCSAGGSAYGECVGSVLPSFQGCATGVDTDCDGAAACSGEHRWSQGLIGQDYKHPIGVSVDKDGNIVIAGEFEGTINLGGGELKADASLMMRDLFVAKYDATGGHLWSKTIGDAADQAVYGLGLDPGGNVILTGWSETPIEFEGEKLSGSFTLKLGPGGEVLWSLPHGGNLGVDGEGNILLAGGFIEPITIGDTTLTSAGDRDAFIAKFDPSGMFLWAVSAGGEGAEYLHHIAVDGAGNVAVAGQYAGVADLGGGPLPPGAPGGNESAFAAKFDKNGSFLWSRSFAGPHVRLHVLSADSAGSTVMSGLMQGPVDFGGGQVLPDPNASFVVKLDQSGSTLFGKSYSSLDASGAPWNASVADVAFDSEDNMLVLGSFDANIKLDGGLSLKATGSAVFVAKYDALGKIIWGKTPGGGLAFDESGGISADPMGDVVVTGLYDNAMDFGGGILYGNPAQVEIFLAKLAP